LTDKLIATAASYHAQSTVRPALIACTGTPRRTQAGHSCDSPLTRSSRLDVHIIAAGPAHRAR
jgi:hypothetical protein